LAKLKAKAVSKYLVEKGIDLDRIKTTYFGETQLLDPSNTREANRKNRRVEFKILKM